MGCLMINVLVGSIEIVEALTDAILDFMDVSFQVY